jgi:hypothetical protein
MFSTVQGLLREPCRNSRLPWAETIAVKAARIPAFFLYLFEPTDVAQCLSACFVRRELALNVPFRLALNVISQLVI